MDHCSKESAQAIGLIKNARGQIDAILRMIDEDRYCVDVSKQLLAAMALLRKANVIILRQHIDTCVREAMGTDKAEEKLEEIALILERYLGDS